MTLRQFMELHGYSDHMMAKAVGVSQPTINRIKNAVNKPSGQTLARIEEVTSGAVSAKDFFPKGN
jgi:DNA-binding transcriptional regulator YdaS (Cro superfamily)